MNYSMSSLFHRLLLIAPATALADVSDKAVHRSEPVHSHRYVWVVKVFDCQANVFTDAAKTFLCCLGDHSIAYTLSVSSYSF